MVRVLIADAEAEVRHGLRMRLAIEPDMAVVGDAGRVAEALALAHSLEPDVIVVDIDMRGGGGVGIVRRLRAEAPAAAVVVLTLREDADTRSRAMEAGASAFLAKYGGTGEVLEAIRTVAATAVATDRGPGANTQAGTRPVDRAAPVSRLSSTARWTAAVRAAESARSDPLFSDPWAAALAGPVGMDWLSGRCEEAVLPIALRTRYFDDFLMRTAQAHPIRQVVLLAAGMDTRAFRLPWPPATLLFELDQLDAMQHKAQILAAEGGRPRCSRQAIDGDLTGAWPQALAQAGFQAHRPSLWLLEGVLFYLPSDQVGRILDDVSTLAATGSWLGFDIINGLTLTHPLTREWVDMQAASGAPWLGTMDDPVALLANLGWQATLSQAGEPDAHFGRWTWPVVPVDRLDLPHNWFVTAQKLAPADPVTLGTLAPDPAS